MINRVKIFLMSTHKIHSECSRVLIFPIFFNKQWESFSPLSTAISYTPTIFMEYLQKISLVSAHKVLLSAHKVLLSAHTPSNDTIFFLDNVSKIHFYDRVHLLHCLIFIFFHYEHTKSDPSQHEVLTCFYQPPGNIVPVCIGYSILY